MSDKTQEQKIREARQNLKQRFGRMGKGCMVLLIFIPLCWFIAGFFGWILSPWSGWLLGEPLTGTWVGTVRMPSDPVRRVFCFHLKVNDEDYATENLLGTADFCDSQAKRHTFYLRGNTDFRGRSVTFDFSNNPDFMDVQSAFRVNRSGRNMQLTFKARDKSNVTFTAEKSDDDHFNELCREISKDR